MLAMSTQAPISVVITTKDEEINLPFALKSVMGWAREVFVLDSGSTDRTRQVAEAMGAAFSYRAWDGYANQKNWAITNLPITSPWVLIIDADESVTSELRDELIAVASADNAPENGFFVNRYFIFLGKRIRHCGYYPSWNIRFFRRGKARYEAREVHEHMIVDGQTGYLQNNLEHYDRRGLEYYIFKHNAYSSAEAREMHNLLTHAGHATGGGLLEGPSARRRWIKTHLWPHLPFRWLLRWFFMYVLRLGFLDGVIGFHFCLFMAAYEHQISLKLRELRLDEATRAADLQEGASGAVPMAGAAPVTTRDPQ